MGDYHHQYGFIPDHRQLMAGRTQYQGGNPIATTEPFFLQSRNLASQITLHHHFHHDPVMAAAAAAASHEVMCMPSGLVKLGHGAYCTNPPATPAASSSGNATLGTFLGVEMGSGWIGNEAGNNSRWPRQETLTLLEIRSRLDSKFKEANQKGPLWDEVSRIMAEEHGYQRSGKKCREKFENLYKYYKKTKEGKAGRQDGKHYRFFRQLEALYGGETSNSHPIPSASETTCLVNTPPFLYQTPTSNTINQESFQETNNKLHSDPSLSFSNASEFETSSSENNGDDDLSAIAYNMMNRSMEKQKGLSTESLSYDCSRAKKKNWEDKVKDFVDIQMGKLLERQEVWMETMVKTIEDREQAKMFREEEWTKQEAARLDRIHEFWAKERAWIEARDVALMEVLMKCTGKGLELSSSIEQIAVATQNHYNNQNRKAMKIDIDHEMNASRWNEQEIFSLIQIRTAMESRFEESGSESGSGYVEEGLWGEIAGKMASLGYDRGVNECKEKWKKMNIYFNIASEEEGNNKKRKEHLKTSNYFQQVDPYNG